MTLRRSIRSQRALSLVVSSLILLVSSALLASGTIAYYALTTTSASMSQEQLLIVEAHVWVNASGSQAAMTIENIGGDALVEYIEVKYSRVLWEKVYLASSADGELTPVQRLNMAEPFTQVIGGSSLTFERASGPIAIESGGGSTLYLSGPFDIEISDVGRIILMVIHTAANEYPVLVNAEFA